MINRRFTTPPLFGGPEKRGTPRLRRRRRPGSVRRASSSACGLCLELLLFFGCVQIFSDRILEGRLLPQRACVELGSAAASAYVRGWRRTVETALFEISISMKPYPSVFHAYIDNMRSVIGFC